MALQGLLDDHQLFHSELQMDAFITARSGGTVYGCYRQALRELYKRKRGLQQLYADKRLKQIEIEELTDALESGEISRFEKERKKVNLWSARLALEESDKVIFDTEREFLHFYQQASELKKLVGELTPERRKELDWELWQFKLREMAAVDWMTKGRLGDMVITFVNALPPKEKKVLTEEIKDVGEIVSWYENHETPKIPESPEKNHTLNEVKDALRIEY